MSEHAQPRTMTSAVGAQIVIDGKPYISFGGSSYLGLSAHPEILSAGAAALHEYGAGIPIPWNHRISTRAVQEVEAAAAAFFDRPAALYLAAGFYFGLASIAAVREQFAAIFFDEWSHYSLREGIAASGLRSYPFSHLDIASLEKTIRRELRAGEKPLVATDGLFSTFGEIAPVDELVQVVMPYGGRILIDESHSFGVLGSSGRGVVEHYDVSGSAVLVGGSLGKAFGTCGGIVLADEAEIAAFRSTPVGYGASTGLPAAAAMCATSLGYVRQHPELLQRLRTNVAYMKSGLRGIGLDVGDSVAPVAAFVTGSDNSMRTLQRELMSEGIFVYHSTYIGAGNAGAIRCGIFADHMVEHIDQLLDALRRLL